MAILAFSLRAQDPPLSGLKAYYPFDGTADDASGNGNNLTPVNMKFQSISTLPSSPVGAFDGLLGYCKGNFAILDNRTDWTWAAWIFVPEPGLSDRVLQRIYSEGNAAGNIFVIGVKPYDDRLVVDAFNQDAATAWLSFQPQVQMRNRWTHLTITLESGVNNHSLLKLYRDGAFLSSTTNFQAVGSLEGSPQHLAVGTSIYYVDNGGISQDPFHGNIDNLRIYDRALSPNEIQQLFSYETGVRIGLRKAIRPSFSGLLIGSCYQLQISNDTHFWTNYGLAFTATNSFMVYSQYFEVDDWKSLFFRVEETP